MQGNIQTKNPNKYSREEEKYTSEFMHLVNRCNWEKNWENYAISNSFGIPLFSLFNSEIACSGEGSHA